MDNTHDSIDAGTDEVGRVMVIDDDPVVSGMLAVTLGGAGHTVVEANAGDEALRRLDEAGADLPDVVIVDIDMPGLDGYETCRRIKAMEPGRDIPVIFLSGCDALEDRLQAFDAGGDDFMSKPFEPEEVLRKTAISIGHRRRQHTVQSDQRAAFGAAMTAMASLGETGATLKFSSQALQCRSAVALIELMIGAMASYELQCQVQLRGPDFCLTRTADGVASPLEASVMDQARDMGRIFSFKNRMVVNYDNVSLLVVNMPLDDEAYCGRIRDHAAMICEAAGHALDNIVVRKAAVERARELQEVADITASAVDQLRQNYRALQGAARVELEGMVTRIEAMYHRLGLTVSQEDTISDVVRSTQEQVVTLLADGIALDDSFGGIVERLSRHAGLPVEAEAPAEDVDAQAEIELW